MTASFLLSQTFVPVAANWILQENVQHKALSGFTRFKENYSRRITKLSRGAGLLNPVYIIVSLALLTGTFLMSGTDIFPKTDTGQVQVRLRLPTGMRVERTEDATKKILALTDSISSHKVEISSAFVGTQPPSFPVNYIHLWTGGPNESVIRINLKKGSGIAIEDFKESLRKAVRTSIPNANISFEPGDLADQVLNLGSNNPIEILVTGRNLAQSGAIAQQLNKKLNAIAYLRDVQIASPLDYPNIKLDIDRVKAGQLGLTVEQISRSTVVATSSSRFTQPNYWLDKTTGTAYQVQVEYPQYKMNTPEQIGLIPVAGNTANPVFLQDVASWKKTTAPGEYDRINQQRFITITANIHEKDLGNAVKDVNKAIASLGELPKGIKLTVRGQADLLSQTMSELQSGLWVAVVVIFLLLAISFQSFRLSLITMSIIPAVIGGSLLFLLMAGQTLNIQSYMGIIMAVGVAVANAILYITNAELYRKQKDANAFLISAGNRLRPILMTGAAMIAGMIPMAIGFGDAGDQTAPLGIAVIGGLLFSMISTLIFLPMLYQSATGKKPYHNSSLDPNDINSKYYDIHA